MPSITVYNYDPNNFNRYQSVSDVFEDHNQPGSGFYPIPACATIIAPSEAEDATHKNLFNGTDWTLTEYHVGTISYNKNTTARRVINYTGPVDADYTLIAPPEINSSFYKFENNAWIFDESKRTELIQELSGRINTETDRKILEGFVYQGQEFYLSMENQFNYKSAYDARATLIYPYTVKGKNEFISFATSAELEVFYLAGFNYVSSCIADGWQAKELLKSKTNQELLEDLCGQV